jgi:ubiquinone/menaquinone biosynthesis C-methylase UbiE
MTDPKKEKHDADYQQWDGICDIYSPYQNRFKCRLDLIVNAKPNVVLDMGCGPGYFAYLLKQINPNITIPGFDFSKSALDKAKHIDKKFERDIDKQDVPQQDDYYDVIVWAEFLEHLYDVKHALSEMSRLLKKGEIGVISVPNYSFWRFRIDSLLGKIPQSMLNEQHIRFFNMALLKIKIEEVGLKVNKALGSRRTHLFLSNIAKSLFSEWLIFEAVKM